MEHIVFQSYENIEDKTRKTLFSETDGLLN